MLKRSKNWSSSRPPTLNIIRQNITVYTNKTLYHINL